MTIKQHTKQSRNTQLYQLYTCSLYKNDKKYQLQLTKLVNYPLLMIIINLVNSYPWVYFLWTNLPTLPTLTRFNSLHFTFALFISVYCLINKINPMLPMNPIFILFPLAHKLVRVQNISFWIRSWKLMILTNIDENCVSNYIIWKSI